MSILINGIDLPKEGEDITLEINHKGEVRAYSTELKETNTDTQAIQIDRPHGRIVDISKIRMYPIPGTADTCYDAPTILESEE